MRPTTIFFVISSFISLSFGEIKMPIDFYLTAGIFGSPLRPYNSVFEKINDGQYALDYHSDRYVGVQASLIMVPKINFKHFRTGMRIDVSYNKTITHVFYSVDGLGFTQEKEEIAIKEKKIWVSPLLGFQVDFEKINFRYFFNPGAELNNMGKDGAEFFLSNFYQLLLRSGFIIEAGLRFNLDDPASKKEVMNSEIYLGAGWEF